MGESHDFRDVNHFATGTVGEPGQRTFFLQLGEDEQTLTLKLEKEQVRALAQFLRGALEDLPSVDDASPVSVLRGPVDAAWVVGQISVGIDEADSRVVLVIEELVMGDDEELAFDDGNRVRAHISTELATGFVATADELMVKGRPPCHLCGAAAASERHACPRLN